MKFVWLLLAILLSCLTLGGLVSVTKDTDTPSLIFDLATSGLLGWGAVGSWNRFFARPENPTAKPAKSHKEGK
ncbi:hypothetical protein [Streptomyces aureus]|uniref:hypothetical protein n=1 Tax=Streptomyces aureus TaxID=193461 RepID=UPI003688E013